MDEAGPEPMGAALARWAGRTASVDDDAAEMGLASTAVASAVAAAFKALT